MLKVRNCFFETNSSSTHCLTIWNNEWKIKKLYWVLREYELWYWDNSTRSIRAPEEKLWILIGYIYEVYPELINKFIKKIEKITKQDREEIFKECYFDKKITNRYRYHQPYWIDSDWLERIYNNFELFIFWDWSIDTFPVWYDYSDEYNWEMDNVNFKWNNN